MATKKQVADMENTIVLLEEKLEKLEDDHATLKQMIAMQNSLIDNLQMMVKMMSQQSLTMSIKTPSYGMAPDNIIVGGASQQLEVKDEKSTEDSSKGQQLKQGGLKHRMSRIA